MIGVDLSRHELRAGLVEGGRVVQSRTASFGVNPEQTLDAIVRTAKALAAKPSSVGVAIPGQVDAGGRCRRLTNVPGFEGARLGEELANRLECPVAVENDGTTAALGERLYGHGRGHPSFLMVTLGTGVGGGLVLGRQLYPGGYGYAGEIGHLNIDYSPDAWPCLCGLQGCLEAYAGELGLVRRFEALGGQGRSFEAIELSARRGERSGVRVLEALGQDLGKALANIQSMLDLNAIVFSGRSADCASFFVPATREALRRYAYAPSLAEVPLLSSELGPNVVILGAAYLPTVGL